MLVLCAINTGAKVGMWSRRQVVISTSFIVNYCYSICDSVWNNYDLIFDVIAEMKHNQRLDSVPTAGTGQLCDIPSITRQNAGPVRVVFTMLGNSPFDNVVMNSRLF